MNPTNNIDSFYIGAYWNGRNGQLKNVVSNTVKTLQKLSEVDEQFLNWYEGGSTRKEALENKVSINAESIEKLYRSELKDTEIDKDGYSLNGFSLILWSGHEDDESSSISFRDGEASDLIGNCCVISFPAEGNARERLLKLSAIKSLVAILTEIWNPDGVVLISKKLKQLLGTINEVGWVTFIHQPQITPNISSKVVHEEFNTGHLFYLDSLIVNDYNLVKELLPIKGATYW